MRKIGRLTASVALNEGLEDIISNATGLSEQQIKDKLQRVRGNTLVRNAFMDYWPYDASRLGRFTVAFACKAGLQEEIAEATELSEEAVVKRLQEENGRRLLINAFEEMTVYDDDQDDDEDEIEKNDDTNEEEEDAVEAHEDLGQRRVAGVRDDDDAIDQLVDFLGISQRTIRRRLNRVNGLMLVRNLFADNWPNLKANENPTTDTSQAGAGRPPVRELVADRWEIIREIGSGGFGTAYEVRDTQNSDHDLAVLKFAQGTESVDRLRKEIKLALRLTHQNICAYRDIARDARRGTFIVLQHGGISLEDLIERHRVLSVQYAFDVIRQAAAGIDYAHQQNVLHQDIKPGNILVDEKDKGNVKVRISDFGISLLGRRTELRGKKTVVATMAFGFSPCFASPEQVRGGQVSRKSDQYSLALVLCAMLEGKVFDSLYTRRDFARLSRKQNAAIKQALERNPCKRHPSCIDFAKAL